MFEKTRKATAFAIKAHEAQYRKGSNLPYIVHPVEVYSIVKKFKDSKNIDEICSAALLHDILEDTQTTYKELEHEFGTMVASIVEEVTNRKIDMGSLTKERYIINKIEKMSSYALVVKLADILANITDQPTDKQVARTRNYYIYMMEETNRKLSRTHYRLLEQINLVLLENFEI